MANETTQKTVQWLNKFEKDGYAVIEDFATDAECEELRSGILKVIGDLDAEKEHKAIFSTREHKLLTDDYFLSSGDKIRYFFENSAFNDKEELIVPKELSLNKIGHALHWYKEEFKKISFSERMQDVAKTLGLIDPAIIQSMYIFKNPKVGGEVCPHQDASFLWMDPLKLYGVWLAVDDATEENGCLWFIPGSHKPEELHSNRRMMREVKEDGRIGLTFTGDIPEIDQSQYKSVPVKKGSLVIIHGLVMHKSEVNASDKPRNAYTLHFIDQKDAKWSEKNWLQPTENLPFTPLYAN